MMIDQMLQWLTPYIDQHGYWLVGVILLLENMGIPLPGEIILISSGLVAFEGQLNIWPIALWATIGAIIGDNLGYLIGRRFGRRVVERYTRAFGGDAQKLEKAQELFLRYSGWAVFLGRFVAVLRIFAGPMAGVLGMPWQRFLICNAAGAVLWVVAVLGGSYVFGANIRNIISAVGLWGVVAAGAAMIYLKYYVTKNLLK